MRPRPARPVAFLPRGLKIVRTPKLSSAWFTLGLLSFLRFSNRWGPSMNKRACLIAAAVLGVAAGGAASSAHAQDTATTTVGGTTISLGGGFAYLTLPETRFTFRFQNSNGDTISKQTNDTFGEYGGGFSGSIATPFGNAFGMPWVGAVHGFWTNIDDSEHHPMRQHREQHLRRRQPFSCASHRHSGDADLRHWPRRQQLGRGLRADHAARDAHAAAGSY